MGNVTIHQLTRRSGISTTAIAADDQLAASREKALRKRAAEGDRDAFRTIVDDNRQHMLAVAVSILRDAELAEDAVQESFIKAYRALPEFRGDSQLSTWLHRITYLTALDVRRQQQRHARISSDEEAQDTLEDSSVTGRTDNELIGQQTRHAIERAMQELSPFEHSVFCLRHLQDFSLKDISRVLDRSEGTIKNILFRAIRKMRDLLADELDDSANNLKRDQNDVRREQC